MTDDQRYRSLQVRPVVKRTPTLNALNPSVMRAVECYNALLREFEAMALMVTALPTVTIPPGGAQGSASVDFKGIEAWRNLDELRLLTSETLHHLRSAADHLVYHVAWLDSGIEQSRTQFPVFSRAADFAGRAPQILRGVSDEHRRWFEALQPYNGVAWTAVLADLSNEDKHKFLHDVVPTLEVRIDNWTKKVIDGVVHLAVERPEVHLSLQRDGEDDRRVEEELSAILDGLTHLVNKFLAEQGKPLLELTPTSNDPSSAH